MILAGNILNIIAPIIQIAFCGFKSKFKVLLGVIISNALWIIAYIFVGIPSASVLSAVCAVIPIVNYFLEKKNMGTPWWLYVIYVAAVVGISIGFYSGIISLLPSVAVLFLIFSTIPRNQALFRSLLICMSTTWLTYAIINSQLGMIIGNSIQIAFLIATIIFYSVKGRKSAKAVEPTASDNQAEEEQEPEQAADSAEPVRESDNAEIEQAPTEQEQ